jgi:hypothetical protein
MAGCFVASHLAEKQALKAIQQRRKSHPSRQDGIFAF